MWAGVNSFLAAAAAAALTALVSGNTYAQTAAYNAGALPKLVRCVSRAETGCHGGLVALEARYTDCEHCIKRLQAHQPSSLASTVLLRAGMS
jgi:hypothetical protein